LRYCLSMLRKMNRIYRVEVSLRGVKRGLAWTGNMRIEILRRDSEISMLNYSP
jgi:hypothetical protein